MPIRFFYLPRGRGYNYQPRFYDERKEELERRKRRIDRELGLEEDGGKDMYIPHIKGEMRRHLKIVNKKRKRTSTTIMLVVLAFLIFLTYMLLRI
ncbi:MAG: hypothetical protein V5A47_13335 [Bacteroidales bacterium]|nr:hypothetical protein [Bacteroidales bacterium]MBS3773837.1 hypothetical protein [Bacteroidales bacterium]